MARCLGRKTTIPSPFITVRQEVYYEVEMWKLYWNLWLVLILQLSREMPRKMASTAHLTDGTSLSVKTSSVFWSCLISLYYIVQIFLNFTAKLLKSWHLCLLFLLKTCMVFLSPSRQTLILYIKSGQYYCIPQPFKYTIHQTLIKKHHAVCMSKTVIQ